MGPAVRRCRWGAIAVLLLLVLAVLTVTLDRPGAMPDSALLETSGGAGATSDLRFQVPVPTDGGSTPGIVRRNAAGQWVWHLRNRNTSGIADVTFVYGLATDTPVTGDWDGNGTTTPGVVRRNAAGQWVWHVRNRNTSGVADTSFVYGLATDTPVTGDWDGSLTTTPGVVRRNAEGGSVWHLRNRNTSGPADSQLRLDGENPVTGDWDGNRTTTPGTRSGIPGGAQALWTLRTNNEPTDDSATELVYGLVTDTELVGDWDGNGTTTPGVVRPSGTQLTWLIRNATTSGPATTSFVYGLVGDRPVTGNWDGSQSRTITPLQGKGAWVDLFDWTLTYTGGNPTVDAASIDSMAGMGMRTLFIQVTRQDAAGIVESDRLAALLTHAHERGVRTCAWFLPGLADLGADQRKVAAIAQMDVDCVAIDIEPTSVQTDPVARNRNLIALSQYARATIPTARPLAAIVLPPVVTDLLNTTMWPDFPWASIRSFYDVWMPMGYWTNRGENTEWRDPYRYTTENVRRLRLHLADPSARVNAIGGIGDAITADDIVAFKQAVTDTRSIGLGIYDWASTPPTLRDDL